MKRYLSLALAGLLALVFMGSGASTVAAKVQTPDAAPRVTRVTADSFVADLVGDWSPDAKKGWQLAAAAMSKQIQPKVPVTVTIILEPLEPNILGRGGGSKAFRDFPGAPVAETWYPVSLANQLLGQRIEDLPYATVRLNSIMPWNYDGDPKKSLAQKKPDFVTTLEHEILHGMGITGSVSVTDGVAEWGDDDGVLDEENHGGHVMYWTGGTNVVTGTPTSLFLCQAAIPAGTRKAMEQPVSGDPPTIYDRFVVDGAGDSVLDKDLFPDPSVELNAFLTSNDLWWNGPAGKAANGGKPFKLYAPDPWRPGSSYAHLDDATYDGTKEALMTAMGDRIDDLVLGPLLLGMLKDMGWTVSK
jgi:hypothetical protein